MRKILFVLLLLVINLFSLKSVLASHVPGGNITYECLGNNQFKVTLTLFEDCATAFISNSPETITITNDCGITGLTSATLNMVVFQDEVSQLCAAALPSSECNGGTYPGVYMHVYEGIVTLPGQCDSWTFSYDNCCRNTSTNVSNASSDDYYFFADLNNLDAPCNNSPQFTAPPIPFSCVGQTVCYNFGIVEIDGDSLSFALVSAYTGSGTFVSYQSGYSGASPIPGISIDPVTGQISFVASQIGNYVVCVQVTEYDNNGNIIGVVIRDIQFEVINCNNQVIDCTTSGDIFNLVGNVTQTGPTSLEMCENEGFSFSIAFQDPDFADSLSIITNISTVLPGSTIQVIHPDSTTSQYDSVVVNIAWTPPVGSANSNNAFTITVNDNACPVTGQQTIVYYINVLGVTTVYSDTTLCIGQTAMLLADAEQATSFTWSVISGDPINIGTNFSCNNCDTAYATPSQTTVYSVTTNGVCASSNSDTVTVTVVPDYSYSMSLTDYSICAGDTSILSLVFNPAGTYGLIWADQTDITYGTDTLVLPTSYGMIDKPYLVYDAAGCYKADTLHYSASNISLNINEIDETCLGNSDGIINATGNSTYQITNYILSGPSSVTNTTGNFSNLVPGTYTVTVVDDSTCSTSQNVVVGNGVVVAGASITDSTTCSYTSDGQIHITGNSGNAPYSYEIFNTSGVSLDSNGTGFFSVGAGTYVYNIYDVNGCSYTDTAIVGSPAPVVAAFTESPDWGVEPLTVTFTNQSQNATNYVWYIDSVTMNSTNAVYTFNEGNYTITLFATDGVCVDSVSQNLTVVATSYIIVPNVFSPDGNMQNDYFYIKYHRITEFHIELYNRWGRKIYESDDVNFKWDGKNKGGHNMDDGTYFYIITATGEDKVVHEEKGTFMLIRN